MEEGLSTRELMRLYQDQNTKSNERMQMAIDKIADAMVMLNHNSTETYQAIEAFKEEMIEERKEMIKALQGIKTEQSKWISIMRIIAYGSIPIVGAIVGIKTVAP